MSSVIYLGTQSYTIMHENIMQRHALAMWPPLFPRLEVIHMHTIFDPIDAL